jgi:hypothetical protein
LQPSFLPHREIVPGFFTIANSAHPCATNIPVALLPENYPLTLEMSHFLLLLAADRNGVSFYHYDSICSLLQMELETYLHARNALIDRDLIAFDGTRFQVLSLPEQPATHSVRELRTPEDFAEHDAATIRVTLRRSSPRGGSDRGNGTP